MRICLAAVFLSLISLFGGSVAAGAEKTVKGLAVHEWGVFTAHDDIEVANADVRAEWDSLPEFFYGRIKGRVLPVNWGPVEFRRKPIIFFHSEKPVELKMRLGFPGGRPGVWWPGAINPVSHKMAQPPQTDFIEWKLGVRQAPVGFQARQPPPAVPAGHWVEACRAVKCDDVFAVYGEQSLDCDHEKFVYYDGVFPQGKRVKVTVGKDGIALTNPGRHAVFDVTVVDRRVAGKVRVGRVAKLDMGGEVKAVPMADADAGKFVAEASAALLRQLTAAGLNADEAGTLIAFRKRDLFEAAGVQVFYRIPQEEYERLLPLSIEPAPEKTVRVGLILHPHCEPDLAERVLAIVKTLDADDFNAREAAVKQLADMGPAAFIHLVRLRGQANLSAEVRSRVELVLEKFDAQKAFADK